MSERVVIIGAGAVGAVTALVLAKRGWEVTLVDRAAMGSEASWAGGGIMFPLLPWKYKEAVNALALAGAASYPALCAELLATTGIDPQYQACGMLALPDFGGDTALRWCAEHALVAELRGDGLWLPTVGQVRNPRLMQALRVRLQALDVSLCEHTEMVPIQTRGGRVLAWRAADGRVFEADAYVVTAGAWSRGLLGEHALHIQHKPMRGQMLLYQAEPGLLPYILYHEDFYLIPRLDGHILAGSTVEDVGFDKSTTDDAARHLATKSAELLPELAQAPLVRHWAGLRPGSPDNVPVIARHPQVDNLFLNTGHFRYGVTMAPASAEMLARLVGGEGPVSGTEAYAFPF